MVRPKTEELNLLKFRIMKNIYILVIVMLSSFTIVAQECNAALFLKKGNVLEYTSFDKKGKALSKASHETLSIEEEGDKLTALIKVVSEDIKGKDSFSSEYEASCVDGVFSVDMARFFDMSKLQQYNADDYSVEMDGDILEFPTGMNAGDALNDGTITVKVNKEDFTLVTMIMNITNRKVHPNETITTKAGSFDCQKVTYDFDSKFGFIKVRGSGIEWYDKDKVIVRTQSFSKNGKLVASSDLTEMKE